MNKNRIYNNLILNIIFYKESIKRNLTNKDKYLKESIYLLSQIDCKDLKQYKSHFPLVDDEKLIKEFIECVGVIYLWITMKNYIYI